jgi:MutS domain V
MRNTRLHKDIIESYTIYYIGFSTMPFLALLSQYLPRYPPSKDVYKDVYKDASNIEITTTTPALPLYHPFKLPITYVGSDQIHSLSPVVVQDLELIQSPTDISSNTTITVPSPAIYEQLFQPSHSWGKLLLPEWGKQFSSDKEFLSDTQEVLTAMPQYQTQMDTYECTPHSDTTCKEFQEIWDAVHHHDFLEKHHFMEWDCLKHLNESPLFLQLLSVGNIVSPLISLLVPILFLVFPFLILKVQGTPITFEVYIQVLQEIAKNHFIGKAIVGIRSMSVDKLIYVVLMFGLYLMQIYQNVMVCRRFYDNTQQLNRHLLNLRKYVEHSCRSMTIFEQLHGTKKTYRKFLEETHKHVNQLTQLKDILEVVSPFQMNLQKVGELGTMLQLYYTVHRNKDFQESLQYSIGFEGYMDNLRGVSRHVLAGNVSMALFDQDHEDVSGSNTDFKDQYYPPLLLRNPENDVGGCSNIVKNTVCMDKNMILTGPNASGKTTLLKTTAMNVIFTQQLGCGFYSNGYLTEPYTHIHSYLNIPDTSERDSLFQAEARRCKEIIDIISGSTEVSNDIKSRHFCIFDELYSGTNPKEASKAAYAFLKYLSTYPNVDFILTTHYISVCRKFRKDMYVRNHQMSVDLHKGGGIKYLYRVRRGISKVEGAVRILKDMNYPKEILGLMA